MSKDKTPTVFNLLWALSASNEEIANLPAKTLSNILTEAKAAARLHGKSGQTIGTLKATMQQGVDELLKAQQNSVAYEVTEADIGVYEAMIAAQQHERRLAVLRDGGTPKDPIDVERVINGDEAALRAIALDRTYRAVGAPMDWYAAYNGVKQGKATAQSLMNHLFGPRLGRTLFPDIVPVGNKFATPVPRTGSLFRHEANQGAPIQQAPAAPVQTQTVAAPAPVQAEVKPAPAPVDMIGILEELGVEPSWDVLRKANGVTTAAEAMALLEELEVAPTWAVLKMLG